MLQKDVLSPVLKHGHQTGQKTYFYKPETELLKECILICSARYFFSLFEYVLGPRHSFKVYMSPPSRADVLWERDIYCREIWICSPESETSYIC